MLNVVSNEKYHPHILIVDDELDRVRIYADTLRHAD